jgi:hypothetical protein
MVCLTAVTCAGLALVTALAINNIALTSAAFGLSRLPADRLLKFAASLNDEGRAYLAEGLTMFANQAGAWRNTEEVLAGLNEPSHDKAISVEWGIAATLGPIAPASVEAMIAAETDGDKRQRLLAGYAWVQGIDDPARGLALDALIESPSVREEHLRRHMVEWLTTRREEALAWLQGEAAASLMSATERGRLLKIYGMEPNP